MEYQGIDFETLESVNDRLTEGEGLSMEMLEDVFGYQTAHDFLSSWESDEEQELL